MLYQLYPRSFADSNGDGIGDIPGVISRLDYLEWLGVDAIWMNPVGPSPNRDYGYDVADYCDVHPDFGGLKDLDELINEAHQRGIRIVLDIVPNHSSAEHPWFIESRASVTTDKRDWYVWADAAPDGGVPNNWVDHQGKPAWEWDAATRQFYLHNFLPSQPDLNWWNDEVRSEFDRILRFWFDRGVDGFRIDVTQGIIKDAELRDNPLTDDTDHPDVRRRGQRYVFNFNRPERHDILRRWRGVAAGYDPEKLLYGETYVYDIEEAARFYGDDDECHLGLNIPFFLADFAAADLRRVVEATEASLPAFAWPCWTMSNHDHSRFPTRWCGENDSLSRCALTILLTLRGTPILYYGDEMAMPDSHIPPGHERDEMAEPGVRESRDPARTPLHWDKGVGAGFTTSDTPPWLPFGRVDACNVADQRRDPRSVLNFTRDLIAFRRTSPDLRGGEYMTLPSPDGVWAWRRGTSTTIAVNLGTAAAHVATGGGVVAIGTDRDRDGQVAPESMELGAAEAVVIVKRPPDR